MFLKYCACPACIRDWGFSPRRALHLSPVVDDDRSAWRCLLMALGPKPQDDDQEPAIPAEALSGWFGECYPTLVDYVTASKWSSGEKRMTSTFNVFYDAGFFKVFLNDREFDRYAVYSGKSVDACLEALEAHLKDASTEWRGQRKKR